MCSFSEESIFKKAVQWRKPDKQSWEKEKIYSILTLPGEANLSAKYTFYLLILRDNEKLMHPLRARWSW